MTLNVAVTTVLRTNMLHCDNIIMAVKEEIVNVDTSNLSCTLLEVGKLELSKIFPKGRGLRHVTPKLFGMQSNISSKLHELQTSNLVSIASTWEIRAGAPIIFPKRGVA